MAIQFISLFFVNQINFQLANFGSQNKFMRFTIELSYSSVFTNSCAGFPTILSSAGFVAETVSWAGTDSLTPDDPMTSFSSACCPSSRGAPSLTACEPVAGVSSLFWVNFPLRLPVPHSPCFPSFDFSAHPTAWLPLPARPPLFFLFPRRCYPRQSL